MKSKVISAVSALLYVAAAAYFSFGVYSENKTGAQTTKAKFDTLLLATKNAAVKDKIGTKEFSDEFFGAVGEFSDYNSIRLTVDDVLVYSYPSLADGLTLSKPSGKFVTSFRGSELLADIIPNSKTSSELALSATIYKIKQDTVHRHAVVSFFLALAGTVLAIVGLLTTASEKKPRAPERSNSDILKEIRKMRTEINENLKASGDTSRVYKGGLDDEIEEGDLVFNDEEDAENPEVIESSEISGNFAEGTVAIVDADNDDDILAPELPDDMRDDDSIDRSAVHEAVESAVEAARNVAREKIVGVPEEAVTIADGGSGNPAEVESSHGNQESEIQNSEIQETAEGDNSEDEEEATPAISSETTFVRELGGLLKENQHTEVSLALIKIGGFDWEGEKAREILGVIRENFANGSESYKYDDETFAVVLEGADLDEAISGCEAILPALKEIMGEDTKIHVGISSMNYRNIPVERITIEAKGALERAEEDPENPIVAFKANPERYKKEIGDELGE